MAVDGPLADDLAIVGRERAADLDGDTPLRAVQLPTPEILVALADGDATVSMKIIQGGNADGAGVFDRRWRYLSRKMSLFVKEDVTVFKQRSRSLSACQARD